MAAPLQMSLLAPTIAPGHNLDYCGSGCWRNEPNAGGRTNGIAGWEFKRARFPDTKYKDIYTTVYKYGPRELDSNTGLDCWATMQGVWYWGICRRLHVKAPAKLVQTVYPTSNIGHLRNLRVPSAKDQITKGRPSKLLPRTAAKCPHMVTLGNAPHEERYSNYLPFDEFASEDVIIVSYHDPGLPVDKRYQLGDCLGKSLRHPYNGKFMRNGDSDARLSSQQNAQEARQWVSPAVGPGNYIRSVHARAKVPSSGTTKWNIHLHGPQDWAFEHAGGDER
ncbi:hypothetical protein BJV74DRAFT_986970 [Russula compacta]|nr:hypothetical protein BJV74DRAFT_986970 [Russula compacta]